MFEEEIEALAARLGLEGADREALRALVMRAAAQSPSSLATVVLDGDDEGADRWVQAAGALALEPHVVTDERFDDLGRIATGGMGQVRRVRDLELNRNIAMKVLRDDREPRPKLLLQFIEEAQTTAQLQHPNIVPVHELGRLPDGRLFFLMKEVRGRTLTELIRDVHDTAGEHGAWVPTADRWTLRRLVELFRQVCQAVAYAHSRGVVHRDLKPDNVMVGTFGEVRVMDWGLAKVLDRANSDIEVVGRAETAEGRVSGTPNYMAPEQAFGQAVSRASDVYSLGAVLYEILAGRPPFVAADPRQVLRMVRQGDTPQVPGPIDDRMSFVATRSFVAGDLTGDGAGVRRRLGRPPVPRELVDVCTRAMAREPDDRFVDAEQLAVRIEAWLDGAQRTAHAREMVARAQRVLPEVERLRVEAVELRKRATGMLADVPTWAPDEDKEDAWEIEDRAAALEHEADLLEVDMEGMLRGALSHAPGLADAHLALAERHRDIHRAAESAGDARLAARAEVQLRAHVAALPEDHPDRPDLVAYLRGRGQLVIRTEPPEAKVELQRYVEHARRLLPIHLEHLGTTPLERRIAMGSYLLVVSHPDRATALVPVWMPRQGRWDDIGPIPLLPPDDQGPDDCYVPAGWAWLGGVPPTDRRRVWVPGFVIRRFPVTNADYIRFLDDLVARGREAEALQRVPRERSGTEQGQPIYGRDADGRFQLVPDEDGDEWEPDWPVILVDWHDARAYAAWEAERTGQPWRLPSEWEREKAARGADGREYPWGDEADDSWSANRYAFEGRPLPASVFDFPDDVSPYGVRGLAGNVLEWCLDDHHAAAPAEGSRLLVPVEPGEAQVRSLRGGAWTNPIRLCRAAQRNAAVPHSRFSHLGFRLARPVE